MGLHWGTVWKLLLLVAVVSWLLLAFGPSAPHSNPDCPAAGFIENC